MFEHTPVSIQDFRGRFDRGPVEAVPPGFFRDEGNLIYHRNGFETRRGFSIVAVASNDANVTRIHEYRRIGEAARFIFCTGSGNFYDSTAPSTPILTLPGVSDFAMVVMFNRAYISPHDRVTGVASQKVYVYDPGVSSTARAAAGPVPAMGPSFYNDYVTDPPSDAIEKGWHLFTTAYETASGHITRPAICAPVFSSSYYAYNAPGGKSIILILPTGPAGTVARHILATKVIPNFQVGTQLFQNWYYVPGGRVANNVDPISPLLTFFDVALQDSADILLDQLDEIPAGVFLTDYDGRLCVGGESANRSTVRISPKGTPESFSSVDGFVNVNPGDAGGGVTNAVSHRGMIYISKAQRFYATNDNGGAPSSWPIISVDSGIGTECFGISSVLDSRGHSRDQFLVAARSGLFQYLGAFNERELTWNIRGLWDRINRVYFNKIQVCVDPQREWLVVAVPLDSNTENSHILVGDYSEALEPEGIKWSLWSLPKKPTSILIRVDDSTKVSKILFASSQNNLYQYDDTAYNDFTTTKIESFYETHLVEPEGSVGQINHYAGIRQRIRGSGSLALSVKSYDAVLQENYPSIALSATPGKETLILTDFMSERASFRFALAAINQWFHVNRYTIFCRSTWTERPE